LTDADLREHGRWQNLLSQFRIVRLKRGAGSGRRHFGDGAIILQHKVPRAAEPLGISVGRVAAAGNDYETRLGAELVRPLPTVQKIRLVASNHDVELRQRVPGILFQALEQLVGRAAQLLVDLEAGNDDPRLLRKASSRQGQAILRRRELLSKGVPVAGHDHHRLKAGSQKTPHDREVPSRRGIKGASV
jgi:hypothetical protein